MGLSGSLQTFPLCDLLQWMGAARKTGTLAVTGRRYARHIFLRDGLIISSASEDPSERLGQFMLGLGRTTPEALARALEIQAQTGELLGKAMLAARAVTEEELEQLLVMKAEETIFGLLLLSDGLFEFLDDVIPRDMIVPTNLDPQMVLLKDLTIVDELRKIGRELGSTRSVLRRTEKPLPPALGSELPLGRRLLALADGRRSLAEIGLTLRVSEFSVTRMAWHLYQQGYLELARRVTPSRPALPAAEAQALSWSFG